MVISSAQEINFTGARGCVIPEMNILNSIGERTPLCRTPVLNWHCMDVMYTLCPLMQFANLSMMVLGMFVCSSFLISECMLTVSKPMLLSRATVNNIIMLIEMKMNVTYNLSCLDCHMICFKIYTFKCCISHSIKMQNNKLI